MKPSRRKAGLWVIAALGAAQSFAATVSVPRDVISLAGSWRFRKDERAVDRLSRIWYWKGPAW